MTYVETSQRKAAEERYKTEQIKLQAKQLELEMLVEKRRGSPPAARSYPAHSSESSGHYMSSGSSYYGNGYSHYSDSSRPHRDSSSSNANNHNGSSSKHSHHDHIGHGSQEGPDHPQQSHQSSTYGQQDHSMQPSPQGRPPFLKINTSVRQYHPQPQSGQRLPPSPHSTLPPLPSNNPPKGIGRYSLPSLNASAQSSPVAVVDYQSHIPPPLTPKDEHVSPTSALSPTQNPNMKRKSVIHDAVMDAVRAKVLRNAAGQSQLQQQHQPQHKRVAVESERERDQNTRRKVHHDKSSVEATKKAPESSVAANAEPKQEEKQDEKPEAAQPATTSPASPPKGAAENGRSRSRSRSTSPPPAVAAKHRNASNKPQLSSSEANKESSPSLDSDRRRPAQDVDSEGN
ncbi:hypothetical protein BGX31_005297 [Mortierella sp. GBA43]|nr:hypothetical protein BGX31_005297 [Mortierella sp. GBA43]